MLMKEIIRKYRQLKFDEINSLVSEICEDTAEAYEELPEEEKKERKEKFWDCLLDFLIDGFASGLLMIGEDKDFPEYFRFLDITYETGETVSDLYDKDVADKQAFQTMLEAEINRCWNIGFIEAGKGTDGLQKTWETMGDEKVRTTHELLEGDTIPYDEEFVAIDGDSAPAPGMFENASNNVNCRCWLTYSKE